MCFCAAEIKVKGRGNKILITNGVIGANLKHVLDVRVTVNKHRVKHVDEVGAFSEAHKLITADDNL